MDRKQVLETMEQTKGSVLMLTPDGRTLHMVNPANVPEDEVLARGNPDAERQVAADLRAQLLDMQRRLAAIERPSTAPAVVTLPQPGDEKLPTTETVPQGGTARQEAPALPVQQDDPRTATPDPDPRPQSQREAPSSPSPPSTPPAPPDDDEEEEEDDEDDDEEEADPPQGGPVTGRAGPKGRPRRR